MRFLASQILLKIKAIQRKDKSEIIEQRRKPPHPTTVKKYQLNSELNIHRHDENAQRSRLLNLAMDWDCIDVANELILKNSIDFISVIRLICSFIFILCSFLGCRSTFCASFNQQFTNIYLRIY